MLWEIEGFGQQRVAVQASGVIVSDGVDDEFREFELLGSIF